MASLRKYREKRDFSKTQEPRGKPRAAKRAAPKIKAAKGLRYVIQKHAARALHYDLRLELDGVMMSWAVTKGPSLVPGEKRLAVHVEDHPVEYNSFEGTIPKGQYGGGTVMIWDRGTWLPQSDPHRGMAKGHLDFEIRGEKLRGRWHLVRMRKRPGERQEPWLLIKSDDEFARGARDADILEEMPLSATTGRSIEEIAAASDRVWHSNRPADDQPEAGPKHAIAKKNVKAARRKATIPARMVAGARKASLPAFVPPSLATLSVAPPEAGNWVHEIKFDGYRMQARLAAGKATLKTRTGLDWTSKFSGIAEAVALLPAEGALLDGEIVSQDESGVSSFSALQEDLKAGRNDRLAYYVFDLLHLDGFDITRAHLIDRKKLLAGLLASLPKHAPIHLSEHFETDGASFLEHACKLHLEGIVSKRSDGVYRSGRTGDWIKCKCAESQELVIAGFEPSATRTRSIRSLLLGYFDEGELRYAGRVGTGFKVAVERDLLQKLERLKTAKRPFRELPEEERRRKAIWVAPKLVAEIEFRGWTHGDVLRQASFKGLREDKPAREVVRESPRTLHAAARASTANKRSSKPAGNAPVTVAGVTLTHPDRVYWEDAGVTKKMLVEYYAHVWDWIAPHLVDRPLALLRCPDGTSGTCFFQKHASAGIDRRKLKLVPQRGEQDLIAVKDLSGLIALAQAGVLEIHTWGTTVDRLDTCNRLVFDLDPGPGLTFEDVADAAREVRKRLADLDLESFLKTTGGKGLHVVVPIAPADFDDAKDFAHAVALSMQQDDPARYVANMAKKLRHNRVFIDYLRNGRGATAIAPYSTRARPGATISVPIGWEELARLGAPNSYNVQNIMRRLGSLRRDPWDGIGKVRQRIPKLKAKR